MKSFIAVSLFVAFVACVRAEDLSFDDESNEPGYFQCKVDLYHCFKTGNDTKTECLTKYKDCMASLIPTMPYQVVTLCKNDLSWCVSHAPGLKEQAGCFVEFAKCLKDGGPTPVTYAPDSRAMDEPEIDDEPTRGQFTQCQVDLYDCNNKGDKTAMECLTDYKTCMAQLIPPPPPPYVETCQKEADECINNASGFLDKAKCAAGFAVCLKNGGPTKAPALA